jgi:hypothetical protein
LVGFLINVIRLAERSGIMQDSARDEKVFGDKAEAAIPNVNFAIFSKGHKSPSVPIRA